MHAKASADSLYSDWHWIL